MPKPSRNKIREIVCDSLSGLTNPIPPTAASESIVIGATLLTAYTQYPPAITGYYSYMLDRIREVGGTPWFGPDVLAFCDPAMTIGDLINIVRSYTT